MPPHVIVPLAGIAIPMVVVPTVMFARHVGRNRHFQHLERMQALRAGVTPPPTVPLPGPGAIVAIGAGVPTACVLGALAATLAARRVMRDEELMAMLAIVWGLAFLLGLCALATALVLGVLLHRANAKATAAATARAASAKPAYDPDLFDAPAHDFR